MFRVFIGAVPAVSEEPLRGDRNAAEAKGQVASIFLVKSVRCQCHIYNNASARFGIGKEKS